MEHRINKIITSVTIYVIAAFVIAAGTIGIFGCSNDQIVTAEKWEEKQQEEESEQVLKNNIPWDEAKEHIGERLTVYGPVVSTFYYEESESAPTFLNIGNQHPDINRFTVVIWGDKRLNFPEAPEDYYNGKTIYVYGLIENYKGVPEIIVDSPSQIIEKTEE